MSVFQPEETVTISRIVEFLTKEDASVHFAGRSQSQLGTQLDQLDKLPVRLNFVGILLVMG